MRSATHLVMRLTYLRTLECIRLERIANWKLVDAFSEQPQEFVIYLVVNEDSGTSSTHLTLVETKDTTI